MASGRRCPGGTCSTRLRCSQPLGWPPDTARVACRPRRRFSTCLRLARQRTAVSTFQLEEDSLVAPSALLEDLATSGLQPLVPRRRSDAHLRDRGIARATAAGRVLSPAATAGSRLRLARTDAARRRVSRHGAADAPRSYSVGAVELYTQCPFKYFAAPRAATGGRGRRRGGPDAARARHLHPRGVPGLLRSLAERGQRRASRLPTCRGRGPCWTR